MGTAKPANLAELRAWMRETGATGRQMAKFLGISAPAFSCHLNGKTDITADKAIRLSLLTGITPDKLVNNFATAQTLKLLGDRTKRRTRDVPSKARILTSWDDVA